MKPDAVRQKIADAIDAARKLGDERGVPEDLRLAVETTGEGFLNTFDACFAEEREAERERLAQGTAAA